MKRILSLLLCLCMFATMTSITAFAAATKISVTSADYHSNGDVKMLNIDFGWDTASAKSRLTVMTNCLRSAGEEGTNKNYGDFTDYGYYGGYYYPDNLFMVIKVNGGQIQYAPATGRNSYGNFTAPVNLICGQKLQNAVWNN